MQDREFVILWILLFSASVFIYQLILLQKYKKLLIRYENIRKLLFETSEKISKTNDENKIYYIVLDAVVKLIPYATNGSILLYDNEKDKFDYEVVIGYSNELKNISIRKEEAFLYKINGFKKAAVICNPEEFDRLNADKGTTEGLKRIDALNISCTLSAPIYIDRHLIGLINIDSSIPHHRFTEEDLNLMEQIKCELEISIKNALAQNKLKHLANYDELTGLINRRKLIKEFDGELNGKDNCFPFCLVMIDLDDFKLINDNYGHYYGDMILKNFSSRLRNFADKSSIVSRLAGDEFVILFKGHDLEMTERKMKDIAEEIMSEEIYGITVAFSYGICEVSSSENMNFDEALAFADVKMYRNKKMKVLNSRI
ncbi:MULTISPECIES: sensor domain-containing diguanylate cyclase [unclassified Sedimentibacter]|uniref:sensor domain-containing diguanylate cyclase n=1 Tax=unclassified Sedimentibacter TaxID=2649220 RepID=UPI0027E1D751|nr:sensor domain-containing diguanylate cyclase [Sedimentibacter sp. MB35-C1]WMJ77580.1 sensor domain-containing diguanylate cyclase [Sedimentibacter sp. MB35-C1]